MQRVVQTKWHQAHAGVVVSLELQGYLLLLPTEWQCAYDTCWHRVCVGQGCVFGVLASLLCVRMDICTGLQAYPRPAAH